MGQESHAFQAEVSRLLDIVAHSLYSNKEIFLRELISNASDACDRLRYAALTQADLLAGDDSELKINISADLSAKTITVRDNGLGMNRGDLVENLGTIARSGTAAFVEQLSGDAKKDVGLIGQFGVGFYSAFMVADKVTVRTRKAGEPEGWVWESDGKGSFTIDSADDAAARGTQIVLHISEAHEEFLDKTRLRQVVKTYSDHIALPIYLLDGGKDSQVNEGLALWARPKRDITDEQYTEFYRHSGHVFDEPWLVLHNRQEGVIEYTNLLFVPSTRPFDLFHPERSNHVKLYVKRVFITDDCADLLPPWLRFMRGVVDSEDLPLNISREMLQHNPVLTKIRSGLVKRVVGELKKKAEKEPETYASVWEQGGAVMKEGIYEDHAQRDELLELARFRSSEAGGWVSLKDYAGRMSEGQTDIFYITGDETKALAESPQLEAFKAQGIEVLLLHDPVDEFWIPGVGVYDGKSLRSVTRGDIDVSAIKGKDGDTPAADDAADDPAQLASLTALLKVTLSDAVKDVRPSRRLTNSAVCLVADDGDVDMHLERILRQHNQTDESSKRILEINPKHSLIRRLADSVAAKGDAALGPATVNDVAFLLLDQALIAEGEPVADANAFARRLTSVMERGLV